MTSTFNMGEIISLVYTASSPNIGFSGISTSSLSITLANKYAGTPACQKGDCLTLDGNGQFPDFFVDDRNFDTYTTTFTAYDSCCKLDKEFDNSNFDDKAADGSIKLYSQTQVFNALALQSGLNIAAPTDIGIQFAKTDLTGSFREILENASEINGVMFVCSYANQIMPIPYKAYASTASVLGYGEVLTDTSSVVFSGLVVHDTTLDDEYKYGSNSIFRYIDSSLIKGNANIGGALYTRFVSATYSSFSMSNANVAYFSPTIPQQIEYNNGTTAIALNMSAEYTHAGWLIQYSSPECQPADTTYKPKEKRDLDKTVKKGTHGNLFIDENYGGIVVKIKSAEVTQ